MATKYGKCMNIGNCDIADSKEIITVLDGEEFVCPNGCGELFPVNQGKSSKLNLIPVIISIAGLVILLSAIYFGYKYFSSPSIPDSANNSQNTSVKTDSNITNKQAPFLPASSSTDKFQNPCKNLPLHRNVWADIQSRGYIIMGTQSDADPMNYTEPYKKSEESWDRAKEQAESGEEARRREEINWTRTGFDYDLMKLLAKEVGLTGKRNVRAREVKKFKDLFCLPNRVEKNGEFSVDLIMSGIAKDESYSDTISWSKPYLDLYYALVTKKSSEIQTITDLKGRKIGIVDNDNVVERFVRSQLPDAKIIKLDDEADQWMSDALNTNQVDAVIQDYPFAVTETEFANTDLVKDEPAKQLEIRIARLQSSDPQFDPKYSIGVPKGDDDLLARINDAISKIKDSPAYIALVKTYLKSNNVRQNTSDGNIYVVKKGDTLSGIAKNYLGNIDRWKEIYNLNNIANQYLIFPGDKLVMPNDYKSN